MLKIIALYKKIMVVIKKNVTSLEGMFYILLVADALFLKAQNDLIYIALLFFYVFLSSIKPIESRTTYIFSLVLLSFSAAFSAIRFESQADKFMDYAIIYLAARVLLDIKDLAIKET